MQSVSYLASLRRRWPLIAVLALLGLALGYLSTPTGGTAKSALDVSHGGWSASSVIGVPPSGGSSSGAAGGGADPRAALFYAGAQTVAKNTVNKLHLNVTPQSLRGALSFAPTSTKSGGILLSGRATTRSMAVRLVRTFIQEENSYLASIAQSKQQQLVKRDKDRVHTLRKELKSLANQAQSLAGKTDSASKLAAAEVAQQKTALTSDYRTAYQAYSTAKATSPTGSFFVVLQPASANTAVQLGKSKLDSKPIRAIIGLVLGLAIGIVLAMVLAQLDRRLRNRRQVEEAFAAPVLIEVPRQRLRGTSRDVVVATDPDSSTAEAYRQLRTMLVFAQGTTRYGGTYGINGSTAPEMSQPAEHGVPTEQTAASGPGEPARPIGATVATLRSDPVGRSPFRNVASRSPGSGHIIVVSSAADERIRPTVAANLAVAFAEIDASVLLMRTAATVDHAPLADSTAEGGNVELSRLLRTTGVPLVKTLDLTQLPNVVGAGRSIADLIAEASELADVVVIEAAPVLAAHDVGVLSSLADDVLMVAEHGYTTVDNAGQAAELLNRMGVRLRGVVVTQIPARQAERSRKAVKRRQSDTIELSGQKA